METATLVLAQAQGGNPFLGFIPMLAVLAIFYFILIVPQRRQVKQHQAMVAALKKGDQVVTAGGIIGEIVSLTDDRVQLKSGNTTLVIERARVSRKVTDTPAAK